MRNIAVVLAGGVGRRMGTQVPKQFVDLLGRTVVEYSIDTFNAHPAIDGVGVVVHPDWRGEMENLARRNRWTKWLGIADGGAERYQSSLSAIEHFGGASECNLLIHDAARPIVDAAILTRVTEALQQYEAVTVAIPSTDTVYKVDEGRVIGIPPRSTVHLAQTPQAFRCSLLREAYSQALEDPGFQATDDCGVVYRYLPDVEIHVVEGSPSNFKITYPHDIQRAELEIKSRT